MNFVERIIGTLTSPDKTMADIAKEPRLEESLVIMAVYAILAAISAYLAVTHIKYVYPAGTPDMGGIMAIITAIGGLIMPFIGWAVVTAVLYLFSMVFGGEGKFLTVLNAIGFSSLVKIFSAVLAILLLTQAPFLTLEIDPNNPFGMMNDPAMKSYTTNPFVLGSNLLNLLGLLWSSLIGVFAIKHTEKLSLKTAAIVVGIPLAIYIVLQYGALLLSFF
jgi:hypothetical protein